LSRRSKTLSSSRSGIFSRQAPHWLIFTAISPIYVLYPAITSHFSYRMVI
jgi:hypothetical protein